MELVLLVIKNQQSKKYWLFLIFVGNARLLFKKQTKYWGIRPLHKKHYSYFYLPKIFTVNTIQTFSMYIYTFKNEIVLYLLLCNMTFFT